MRNFGRLPIPHGCATIKGAYEAPGDAAATVVVFTEIFDSEEAEGHIELACESLARGMGFRLLVTEGAGPELRLSSSDPDIKARCEKALLVSAGLRWFLERTHLPVTCFGIDEMRLWERASTARDRLRAAAGVREAAFEPLRPLVKSAQERWYPAHARQLRAPEAPWAKRSGARLPLGEEVSLLSALARGAGIDPFAFPSLSAFESAFVLEKQLDFPAAERERKTFLEALLAKALGWVKVHGGDVQYDPEVAPACLRFWVTTANLSEEELDEAGRTRGLGAVLKECQDWLFQWLLEMTVQVRHGGELTSKLWDEMIRLALCLKLDFWGLRRFRDYVAYLRLATDLRAEALFSELDDYRRLVFDRCGGAEVRSLFQVEEALKILYTALCCEITPRDAAYGDIYRGELTDAVRRLCGLAGRAFDGPLARDVGRADELLLHCESYIDANMKRSERLAQNALALLKEHNDDRMIVVAGGFHSENLTRVLERTRRDVSWYVLSPKLTNVDYVRDANVYFTGKAHGKGQV